MFGSLYYHTGKFQGLPNFEPTRLLSLQSLKSVLYEIYIRFSFLFISISRIYCPSSIYFKAMWLLKLDSFFF